jgi:hypothetical protein
MARLASTLIQKLSWDPVPYAGDRAALRARSGRAMARRDSERRSVKAHSTFAQSRAYDLTNSSGSVGSAMAISGHGPRTPW